MHPRGALRACAPGVTSWQGLDSKAPLHWSARMLRLFKHVVLVVLFVVIAGCSGGGCAQGCSCGGVTPLPAGFPTDKRIENAASMRLTDSGITFLEQNLGTM